MNTYLLQIRDQQKEIWNRFSSGWKKWDDTTMNFLKPVGDEIVRMINPKGADMVLDIASGTGEPGLTIAPMLNGGMVISTDISEAMLDIAREKSAMRGIKNLDFVACDASELPFPEHSFDAISCRFGFMFFPDMLLAAKEMVRVLRPGGRIAIAVWNVPEKNFWATGILNIISRDMLLVPPPPGAPGLFRCAKNGFIADLFKQAGLKNISEKEINGKLDVGSPEVYWNYMTEVAAPVVSVLNGVSDSMKTKIKNEVFDMICRKYPYPSLSIESSALVIYGEK
jgi:ubiquinone/menaquinone biosynthesis C-methylase UbiE